MSDDSDDSDIENETIAKMFKEAKNDPSLFSKINIAELLEGANKKNINAMENKTTENIQEEIFNYFVKIRGITEEQLRNYCQRLIGHRMIHELHEFHKSKNVKMYDFTKNRLKMGGKFCGVKFTNKGTCILCKSNIPQCSFVQYKYDDYVFFQQLSEEEMMILLINEHVLK